MKIKKQTLLTIIISAFVIVFLGIIISDDIVYYFNDEIKPPEKYDCILYDMVDYHMLSNNTVRVRFVEMKRHISKYQRAEYVFEVIEWLNYKDVFDTNAKTISVYSVAYEGKFKSQAEIQTIKEGKVYIPGEEYIIITQKDKFANHYYIPLSDISKITDIDYLFSYKGFHEEMSADEIVAKFKEYIAEEKQNDAFT